MTRADQGLPPKIEDEAVLEAAAALLVDALIEWTRKGGSDARPAA
jgi:hypothetical protein